MSIAKYNNVFERVDLSLLKYFFAVASHGGFSKASRATGVSQPSLSLGLKKLEKALSVDLVERTSNSFSLTPSGIALFSFCQRLEGSLAAVVNSLGAELPVGCQRYRLGVAFSLGCTPITEFCKKLAGTGDILDIEITSKGSPQLLSDLSDGLLDAAVVLDDIQDSRVHFISLLKDQVVFVVSPELAEQFVRKDFRQAISYIPNITYTRETLMRYVVDGICVREELEFQGSIAVSGVEDLKCLLLKGVGGAFVLRSLVERELEEGSLVEPKGIPFGLPRRGVMLAVRKGDERGDIVKLIKASLESVH